ncbi:MAG: glutathione peroxidase [Bacteroidales bacterium]|nr:glutathione peroxidase [Bacteroidales bacterium]MCF8455792.1 glutathione peroxidase [Bacteroidales bacterium]
MIKLKTADRSANISDITVKDINGNEVRLSDYKGKVLLIVNVASKCGFTPQYTGLQKVYETYKDQGFEVLGFPCNDFGKQEPGTNEEIKSFCSLKFAVKFPMFDKVHVKGDDQSPLFDVLTNNRLTGKSSIKWNFEKFIIDKEGNVVERFRSITKPESKKIISAIEKELKK